MDLKTELEKRANFFNGILGKNKDLQNFYITNAGDGISVLEGYWTSIMQKHTSISKEHIHFPGNYSTGAGVDCQGAPAGLVK